MNAAESFRLMMAWRFQAETAPSRGVAENQRRKIILTARHDGQEGADTMNTKEILVRVNDAMKPYEAIEKAADSRSYNAETVAWTMKSRLAVLIADLEAQVRLEYASERGSTNATRTITKMLNYLKKHDARESLHYAWIDSEGRQCVCDGFRAFRLNEPLPLEPRPDNAGETIDLDKIMPSGKDYASTPLPSIQELKAHIEIERAKAGKVPGKRKPAVLWDFGDGKPMVNADYLLDLMQVFPDATEIFHPVGTKLYSALYVKCDAGDAILLPVRNDTVNARIAAAQQAIDDAEQAIREQAEAEGHDPAYVKERMERHARAKAKAEKELADRLAWIQAESARHEDYAVEPDEFEYLVFLMDEIKRNAA